MLAHGQYNNILLLTSPVGKTLYPVTFRHLLPRRLRQFTPAFAAAFATLRSTPACSPSNSQHTPAFAAGFATLGSTPACSPSNSQLTPTFAADFAACGCKIRSKKISCEPPKVVRSPSSS